MKIAILSAVVLLSASANADTIIIEFPDHYYVESAGTTEGNLALLQERKNQRITAKRTPYCESENNNVPVFTSPVAESESAVVLPLRSKPVMYPEFTTQSVNPAEQRVSIDNEIQRLQIAASELMTPNGVETMEQAAQRQRATEAMLRKIKKLSLIMINKTDQGN
jgi:hypothetical protein